MKAWDMEYLSCICSEYYTWAGKVLDEKFTLLYIHSPFIETVFIQGLYIHVICDQSRLQLQFHQTSRHYTTACQSIYRLLNKTTYGDLYIT